MKKTYTYLSISLIFFLITSLITNASNYQPLNPLVMVNPDTIFATINNCNDSITKTLNITNNGSSPLLFSIQQQTDFFEGFEDGLENWNIIGNFGIQNTGFESEHSLSDSPDGNYINYADYYATMKDSLIITNKDSAKISYDIKYALECSCDYLYIQLSVNNGSWINLNVYNCSSDWTHINKDLSSYVNNGDYIKIRIYFHTDYSVFADGTNIDNISIKGVGNMADWLNTPVSAGMLLPGESITLNVNFYSQGLNNGTYLNVINLSTNDPLNPVVYIPAFLTVNGSPFLVHAVDTLVFGNVMENATKTDTVWIQNMGCTVLTVDSIFTNSPFFSVSTTAFTLPPGHSKAILVSFQPDSVDHYEGGLLLYTNDPLLDLNSPVILLNGYGTGAPFITTDPLSFNINLNCGDSVTVPLVINNTGLSDLYLHNSFTNMSDSLILYYPLNSNAIDYSGNGINGNATDCTPSADRFNFAGKAMSFNGSSSFIDVPDGVYFNSNYTVTAWVNPTVTKSWSRLIDFGNGQNVDNVLCALSRSTSGNFLNEIYNNTSSGGYVYCSDPLPLNTWTMVTAVLENSTATVYINGAYCNSGHTSQLPRNVLRTINYIGRSNWSADSYFEGKIDDLRIYNRALDATEVEELYQTSSLDWLQGEVVNDTIAPGESQTYQISFNTTNLNAGIYTDNISILTNDPLHSNVVIPVTLTITGVPEIQTTVTAIDFDSIMQHTSAAKGLKILNTGCDTLFVSDINLSPAEYSLSTALNWNFILPHDSAEINVIFAPQDTGVFNGVLSIMNNDELVTIPLSGYSSVAPEISWSPDTLSLVFDYCNDTLHGIVTLTNNGLLDLEWTANTLADAGSALSFDNYGENVSIGNFGNMPDQGTIEFWQWTNVLVSYNNSFCTNGFGSNGNVGIRFEENNSGEFGMVCGNDNGSFHGFTITHNLNVNAWHHFAASWDKTTNSISMYMDGYPQFEDYYCDTWATNWSNMRIGVGWAESRWWNGMIDEFRIWGTRRTLDEIRENMNHSLAGNETGLIAYWDMNEGSGNTIIDKSGNGHDGTFTGTSWVTSTIPISSYVSISPTSGTINPGGSADIDVTLMNTGLNAGTHYTSFGIFTNDPVHEVISYPCKMDVIGLPSIVIEDTIQFGSIMQYAIKTDTLTVTNNGCDTLVISGISQTEPAFPVYVLPLIVLPKSEAQLYINFSPGEDTGFVEDHITLFTNAGDVQLYLTGSCYGAPQIQVNPTYFDVLLGCFDSLYQALTISNTGISELIVNFNHLVGSGNPGGPIQPECQPQTNNYCCGIGVNHVLLEQINRSSSPGTGYQDYSVTDQALLHPGQLYTLTITTGEEYEENVAVWIDFNNSGTFENEEQVMNSNYIYITHTVDFIVPDWCVLNVPLRMRVISDYYGSSSPTPCGNPDYGQVEDFAVRVSLGITLPEGQFTILPGDSIAANILFSGNNLPIGSFQTNFTVYSNDPTNNELHLDCYINVTGEADPTFNTNAIDFGDVMQYTVATYPMVLTNNGCDTLEITDAYSDDPVFTILSYPNSLLPGESQTIEVTFNPIDINFYDNYLWFITNTGDKDVHVTGNGTGAPQIWLNENYVEFNFNCNDSSDYSIYLGNDGSGDLLYNIAPVESSTEGLLLYLPFNGNTYDESGHERTITNYDATLTTGIHDEDEGAYYFENGQYMSYNNSGDITSNINPLQISVSLWAVIPYNFQVLENNPTLFNLSGDPNVSKGVRIYCDNTSIYASVTIDNQEYVLSGPAVFDEFVHIAVTYNGNNLKLYINGLLYYETGVTGSVSYNAEYNAIGIGWFNAPPDYSHYFTGTLDEIRVYNRALSASEIQYLYTGQTQLTNISFNPQSGTVMTGGFLGEVVIHATSTGLVAGEYTQIFNILSNDPIAPSVPLTVKIKVNGDPQFAVAPDCLHYGSHMQFTTTTDSVLITNAGCNTLSIWGMSTEGINFSFDIGSFDVPAFSSFWLPVHFVPQQEGDITDMLHLYTNAGDYGVCLTGNCTALPVVGIDPGTINKVLSCQQTGTATFSIYNTGLADLIFTTSVAPGTTWLTCDEVTDTISNLETVVINVHFDRGTLQNGLYNSSIGIVTNDPFTPTLTIPVYLLVPNPLLPVRLPNDTGYCTGTVHQIFAGNFVSYLWNDGSTGSTLTVSTGGVYYIDVIDAHDCPSSDTIVIAELAIPQATAFPDTALCANGTIQLGGSATGLLPSFPTSAKIGAGTNFSGETGPDPFGTYYMDHRTQLLYKKQELLQAGLSRGNITSLGIVVGSPGVPGLSNFNIKIKNTNLTTLNNYADGMTQVYNTSYYYPQSGENLFLLQTPFYWDGHSNLIVEFCFDNNGWSYNSTFEYTNVTGSVFARFCDNCAPGCSMTGGTGYSQRANLLIIGDGDFTRYSWTGPENYTSSFQSSPINNAQLQQMGTYVFQVDNGYGCVGVDTMNVTIFPSPVVEAGSDVTILGYDSTQLNGAVTGGITPYSTVWTPSTGLSNPGDLQSMAGPMSTTTYTLNVMGSNQCANSDQVVVTVIPRYSVSGQIIYNNAYYSALPGVKIFLENQNSVIIDSTITDLSGNYIFPRNVNGSYFVRAHSNQESGGVNATDALQICRHITFLQSLTGLRLTAADVSNNLSVSSADALLVLHKTVGNISTFPAGDWLFERKNFTINGGNSFVDLYGLCTGDVNGSFIPLAKISPSVALNYNGEIKCAFNEDVEIPIFISEDTHVGAMTLALNYPEDLLSIDEITSALPNMVYTINNGSIRIGWNSVNGEFLGLGKPLFTLHAIRKTQKIPDGFIRFYLDDATELADPFANVIYGKSFEIPLLTPAEAFEGVCMLGQNRPNPANSNTEIPFYIPESGSVRIVLENLVGEKLGTILESEIAAGYHVTELDCNGLAAGMYIFRMTYRNENQTVIHSRKMLINR